MPINPTELQSEASRTNGQNSHGPVTDEGKASSSRNALKLGLYAKSVLIPGETQEEYDRHCAKIRASFHCETGYEEIQLDDLCNTEWQIIRCHRLHTAALAEDDISRADKISLHHNRLKRMKNTTEAGLKKLISEREEAQKKEIEDAALIRRLDLREGRDRDMTTLGFVFTNKQVDNWIRHQDALQRAREVFRVPGARPRL